MREWLKVVLGVLALTIGASAPTLILEALRPGSLVALNVPSPRAGNTQQQHQPDAAKEHQHAQSTQQPSENAPPTQQAQDNHSVAPKTEDEREWYTRPDWWVAGFTAALFIATTGLWIFTALLWLSTRRAVSEGQKAISAAQASADAANAQAGAAVEANKINREVLIAIDRPWIAVRMEIPEGEPVTFGAEAIEAKIQIRVENVGKSPATRINCAAEMHPDMVIAQRRVRDIGPIDIPYQHIVGFGKLLIPGDYFVDDFDLSVPTVEFKQQIMDVLAEGRPAVIIIVWYNILAASDPKTTIITGEIAPDDRGKYGFDGTQGVFSDVKIIESFVSRAT